jgi:hypothetical protein
VHHHHPQRDADLATVLGIDVARDPGNPRADRGRQCAAVDENLTGREPGSSAS